MSKVKNIEFDLRSCKWNDDVGSVIAKTVDESVDDINNKAKIWAKEEENATVNVKNRFIYKSLSSEIKALRA